MFNNVALDVAIGLIFIFLIYSLLASVLLELIAKIFNLKGRNLLRAIRRMLEDEPIDETEYTPLIRYVYNFFQDFVYIFKPIKKGSFLDLFYRSPTIRYLGETSSRSKPTNINPNTFSQTIIQILRGKNFDSRIQNESSEIWNTIQNNLINADTETMQQIRTVFEDSRRDIVQFRINLEKWFDEMMCLNIEWYKKQSQILLFWIGLALAISFNIDSIAIVKILMTDDTARKELVDMAISKQEQYGQVILSLREKTDTTSARITRESAKSMAKNDSLIDLLKADGTKVQNLLGLGRDCYCKNEQSNDQTATDSTQIVVIPIPKSTRFSIKQDSATVDSTQKIKLAKWIVTVESEKTAPYTQIITKGKSASDIKIDRAECPEQDFPWIGWLLTALAISLGGPFWYEILTKLISARKIMVTTKEPTTRTDNNTQPPIVG
jgi:hypothetical protein